MKHLKVINAYFLKYKWHFLGGLLFVSLSTIFGTYQGVIVRNGTNKIIEVFKNNQTNDSGIFISYGLTIIGLAITSGIFMFLMRQTIIVMSRHIEYDQKNEIYNHYQVLDASFFKQNTTGDLMNRISEDVGKVRMYTGPAIMYLANTIVTTITVLSFMLSVNVQLTLIVFLPLPILSYLIYRVSDMINKQSGKVQKELGNLTTQAQETFSAIRLIKAYAREKFFIEKMHEKNEVYKKTALKLATIESFFGPVMILMIGLSVLITVWYGGKLTIQNKIEPGNVTEFIFYVFRLTWPFASLGWVTSLVQRAAASQERINEFLNTKPSIKNSSSETYLIKGDIEFKNVEFIYPENNIQAIKNISFKLKQGQTLGITGKVGSGKSSILNLITRQYDVTNGEILIDQKNIKQHNLHLLRKNMGVVPQEVFLFSDTIGNNILFGSSDKNTSIEKISFAAKQAQVHDNIMTFPKNYETLVGERGVTLSGGQKQRISIARALINKPQLLIFDDCLSAVDTETEEAILNNLKHEMENKTAIIVSHRISSLKNADLILYLVDGEILEMGTHNELMAMQKNYFNLHQMQSN
ncbi:MAG: ABC transporter ATP-binding protein [Bacteroidota bacterium]|nr:ABC transporter ATP-binding protein [Bacteroidota bacterium]MDP3145149.1 ABC transporter ATP-binding protein [Bacteroidota bacterium]